VIILKKTVETIRKLIEHEVCDNLIMESLMLNILKYNGIKDCSLLDINYNEVKYIKDSMVFSKISENIMDEYNDYILPSVYEITKHHKIKRKIYGLFYTPFWLIEYLVKNTLNIKNEELENIRILEPSCGCGSFLIYIFEHLFNLYKNNTDYDDVKIIKSIIENNIYAYDIDNDAIKYAIYSLKIKIYRILRFVPNLKFNIYSKDFLLEDIDFKFDFVIGNPPFLENRKINKYYDKNVLKRKFETAKGRFDIYGLFLEKSLNHLKKIGKIGFVLPSTLLYNNNFTNIRTLILNEFDIEEIINLGSNIFVDVDTDMITIIINSRKTIDNNIRCKNITKYLNKKDNIHSNEYKKIPQEYYKYNSNHVFDIDSCELVYKLRKKIYSDKYIKINDKCEIVAGIATGNIRNKLLSNEKTWSSKKVLEGKNINNYIKTWNKLYIDYDKSLIDKENGEYATFMRQEFIDSEKILIRQTADRFICTYDNEKYYLLNTLYSLIIREEYKNEINIKYVLALLNSKLYSFLYRSLIREKGKVFPQVKIYHIQLSPFKMISLKEQKKYVDIVENILILSKYPYKNKDKINDLTKEIDNMVYKLFDLNNKEIELVEKEMIT